MVSRPGVEFNALAVAPQELMVRLAALAQQGAGITSIFTDMADKAGLTEKGREAKEREYDRMLAVRYTMMAEQVAAFQKKLDAMHRESYESVIESEERLREAREALERIRERAFEVEIDGRKVKVYRDGDQVRDDEDELVDESIIRAADIPDSCPTRAERRTGQEIVEKREEEHVGRLDRHARIEAAQEALREDGLTPEEFEEIKDDLEPVARRFEDARPSAEEELTRPHPVASTPGPM